MSGIDAKSAKKSFFWNAVETYAGQIVAFVIGIVMARLLSPAVYGLIGMTTIFTCVAEALIFAGFPTALIRKEKCTDIDYSTVFYFNLLVGILLYVLMYFSAPLISDFYNISELVGICRWMGVLFLINSVGGVSITILRKEVRFKEIALITLLVSLITGATAIYLAYKGWGVWALVAQNLVSAFFRNLMVWVRAKWHPILSFSMSSFRELFGFGSKILGANIVVQIYQNIYSLVIGKFFNASSLGFFTRADGYSRIVPINIAGVIQKTLFPLLSHVQNEPETLRATNKTMIQVSSFLIFPSCMIMAGVSYPLISVMISDRWIETAPLLSILCVAILPDHLYYINNDFISITGNSGALMKEQVYSKIITLVFLISSIPFGLKWIAVGKGMGTLVTYLISSYYLKQAIGTQVLMQIKLLFPIFVASFLIGFLDYVIFWYLPYNVLNLIIVVLASIAVYLIMAMMAFPSALSTIKRIIRR